MKVGIINGAIRKNRQLIFDSRGLYYQVYPRRDNFRVKIDIWIRQPSSTVDYEIIHDGITYRGDVDMLNITSSYQPNEERIIRMCGQYCCSLMILHIRYTDSATDHKINHLDEYRLEVGRRVLTIADNSKEYIQPDSSSETMVEHYRKMEEGPDNVELEVLEKLKVGDSIISHIIDKHPSLACLHSSFYLPLVYGVSII